MTDTETRPGVWWFGALAALCVSVALALSTCGVCGAGSTPMDDLYQEAPTASPATTAYPGRAPGVVYEADVGADVAGAAP